MSSEDVEEQEQREDPSHPNAIYRQLAEQAADGIFIVDGQGNVLLANSQLCEMLGYTRGEVLRLNILDTYLPEEKPKGEERLRRLAAGESLIFERYMRTKNGAIFPVETNVIKLADGRLQAITRDISERKHAEEDLRREKEFSDHVINSLPGVFYMIDSDGRLVRWNRKANEVTGYEDAELARMASANFHEGEDKVRVATKLREAFDKGEACVEANLVTKNGARIPYYFTGRRLSQDGKTYVLGLGMDISARVKAEEALRLSEIKLQTLMDCSPVAIGWMDENGRFEYLNHRFTELFGYTLDDIPTLEQWYRRAYPDTDPGYREVMVALTESEIAKAKMAGGNMAPFEAAVVCKDGSTRWVIIKQAWIDHRVMEIYTDITRLKQAIDALRKSDQRHRAFVANSCEGIWRLELDQPMPVALTEHAQVHWICRHARLAECNDALARMFGYGQASDIIGNRLDEVLPGVDWLDHDVLHNFVRSEYQVVGAESSGFVIQGHERCFRNSFTGAVEKGQLVRIWGVQHDITDLKHMEVELWLRNDRLERRVQDEVTKNREKDFMLLQQARLAATGEMIHNIAHQWKQPLNALSIVLGDVKSHITEQNIEAEALDELLQRGRSLIVGMSDTVDDFRNFFRPDLKKAGFDIGQAVGRALSIMEAALKESGIEVAKALQPGLKAYGYPNQFAHAVLNLIANAKDAIGQSKTERGRIEIRLEQANGNGVLSVQDNGGGIPEDVRAKLFAPYFTTKEEGSGIGLYMSKMIIERSHHGTIEVTNLDGGAMVSISVPIIRTSDP